VIAQLVLVIVPGLARPTFPWHVETVQVTAGTGQDGELLAAPTGPEETNPQANKRRQRQPLYEVFHEIFLARFRRNHACANSDPQKPRRFLYG
jgi:hypothetical protein